MCPTCPDPIGITAFCAVLLLKASTAIISGKETPLSRAIGFLYREYDVTAFWWELAEMLRKFLLVGLFVTVDPGSMTQIAIGTIVAAMYLMVRGPPPVGSSTMHMHSLLHHACSRCIMV